MDSENGKYLFTQVASLTKEQQSKWVSSILSDPQEHHFMIAVAGELVGHASVRIQVENELGKPALLIGPRKWKQTPVAAIALHKLLQVSFETLNLKSLSSLVHRDNLGAISLYEAAGFHVEKNRADEFYTTVLLNSQYKKSKLYALFS